MGRSRSVLCLAFAICLIGMSSVARAENLHDADFDGPDPKIGKKKKQTFSLASTIDGLNHPLVRLCSSALLVGGLGFVVGFDTAFSVRTEERSRRHAHVDAAADPRVERQHVDEPIQDAAEIEVIDESTPAPRAP